MTTTTIKLYNETKSELDRFREYKNESYDEVLRKLLFIAKNIEANPKVSKETLRAITAARKRIAAGNYLTEKQAKKRLGL